MGYLVTILGVLGSIAANFAALRYFIKPLEVQMVDLKSEVKDMKGEIREIRRDVSGLARELHLHIGANDCASV